ncbi:MAG: amidohydrolase family protein [Candidatus Latescibacteria bacterium]|jgi:predicted TIM-barrel fold metal-dependent hydrolase|nr:amidohydrolase family protein [Candidatus Latescibacterota bacterium]MBT5832411.1 amidohydrolase family protein [Candidatus Latescibacterota bacterium]
MIDAYCHVGLPRFGTAEEALTIADLYSIQKSVLVLGPMVPDFGTLIQAMQQYKDRIRGVGIPFGNTPEQQIESTEILLHAGVTAMRLQGPEMLPEILNRVGEAGRWIYAIGLRSGGRIAQTNLDWLEKYPNSKIMAPHFLSSDVSKIEGALTELLQHPHFFPIFSRHGGLGSQEPYPHNDLKPWVERTIELAGYNRMMWGSECPVLYWRNENMPNCQNWLNELLGNENLNGFLGTNAQREIFDTPPPKSETVALPNWIEETFDRTRTIPAFDYGGLELPMDVYEKLHHRYVSQLEQNNTLTFAEFVVDVLKETVA